MNFNFATVWRGRVACLRLCACGKNDGKARSGHGGQSPGDICPVRGRTLIFALQSSALEIAYIEEVSTHYDDWTRSSFGPGDTAG